MKKRSTGETIFSWEALEYKDRAMKTDWFWALGIIALAGSITAFIYNNFLFGMFIILASIAVVFFGTVKPKRILYEITTEGVIYEEVFYPFETLHAFWINDLDPNDKKLLLKSERFFVPILTLPFESDEDAQNIFEALDEIIPEEPLQEPWGHLIMERLGF
jgi:hypothetical protein